MPQGIIETPASRLVRTKTGQPSLRDFSVTPVFSLLFLGNSPAVGLRSNSRCAATVDAVNAASLQANTTSRPSLLSVTDELLEPAKSEGNI